MTSSSFTRSFCAGGSGAGAGGCSRRPSSNFRMLLLLDRPCSFPNASRASRNGSGRYNSTLLAGGVSSVANLPLLRERSDFENPNSPTPSGWYENTSPIQPSQQISTLIHDAMALARGCGSSFCCLVCRWWMVHLLIPMPSAVDVLPFHDHFHLCVVQMSKASATFLRCQSRGGFFEEMDSLLLSGCILL